MILTPLDNASLATALSAFAASLGSPDAQRVFTRIARPDDTARAAGAVAAEHHRAALELAAGQDMGLLPGSPAVGVSWDGRCLRSATEAYVLIHEVAHFQLAAPARRRLIDFGLGAGPETGDCAAADRAACLFGIARETEEAMASLLGVLWEAELGQPALASFIDQNWLEGAGRPSVAAYFEGMLQRLRVGGFVDAALHPTRYLRREPDVPDERPGISAQESALCGPAE